MRTAWIVMLALTVPLLLQGCARPSGIDALAEAYVKLVLAVGRHDQFYVDAFYGPPAWKSEANAGAPIPVAVLLQRTRSLLDAVRSSDGPLDRKRYLETQLVAIEAYLRRLSGERMTLTEECRLLYDAEAPHHDVSELAAAHEELERLVPGEGPLGPRIEALRKAVYIPKDKIEATLEAALNSARKATLPFVTLPQGESFQQFLVHGKPWGAYNWYLGKYKSRIELNTDLDTELNGLLGTMCHEGYPGHHVYNALIEEKLVNGEGRVEYTVYPLYSPQSLLAEGTANAGIDVVFTDDERRRVLTDVLGPIAGVSPEAILAADRIRVAMRPLRYVNGEGARMLLDEGRSEDEVVAFLMKYGLVNEQRAKKSISFAKTYRSYVFNYSLGEDLVRGYVGNGPDRGARYFDLLKRAAVPSDLAPR